MDNTDANMSDENESTVFPKIDKVKTFVGRDIPDTEAGTSKDRKSERKNLTLHRL